MKKASILILRLLFKKKMTILTFWLLLWNFFFDENSIVKIISANNYINFLENEKKSYISKISSIKEEFQKISGLDEDFEKFSREKFFFKRKNETVFVIKS